MAKRRYEDGKTSGKMPGKAREGGSTTSQEPISELIFKPLTDVNVVS
jgi:hypothetical protein